MILYLMKPPRYDDRETAERVASAGVSVGLVWTAFGGEVQFVEATAMVGKGDLHLTGQLGDVIKESAQIAMTWVNHLHLFQLYMQYRGPVEISYMTFEDIALKMGVTKRFGLDLAY